jgi:ribonuclease P protein component
VETLRSSGQFERVRRVGRTWASGLVVLSAAPNGEGSVRCGFVAGKKVGGAVERNRARRLMKEAVRLRLSTIRQGWDLVWIARAGIAGVKLDMVSNAVDDLLRRSKLAESREVVTGGAQSRIIDRNRVAPATQDNSVPSNSMEPRPDAKRE